METEGPESSSATRLFKNPSPHQESIFLGLWRILPPIPKTNVFQPRLAAFTQTLYDRWEVPALQINVLRTRVSILRLALQVWDTETGDLVWSSTVEGAFQEEAFTDEPVYLREAGRITWGSIISDFAHGKTASRYNPANNLLDSLIGPGNVDEDAASHHPAAGSGGT